MKLSRTILAQRYIPFVNFILMFGHVVLLMMGYDYPYAEIVQVCLGFYLIHMFSKVLNFCLIHRLAIYYAYITTVCIYIQRLIGFGKYRDEAQMVLFVIGAVLLVYFCYSRFLKRKCHERTNKAC